MKPVLHWTNQIVTRLGMVRAPLTAVVLALATALAHQAWVARAAVTITVTTTADDLTYTDGCSLREALEAANQNETYNECYHDGSGGVDTIVFNIPGPGPHTITLNDVYNELPAIYGDVILDGTSEPDFAGTPVVVLNGAAISGDGLRIAGGTVTVRGLVIRNFSADGVEITGGSGHVIQGNYIGLAADGVTAAGNAGNGILIIGAVNTQIGGATPAQRNLISANGGNGIAIDGVDSVGHVISGNYIGVDGAGVLDRGNQFNGVRITNASGNRVGGPAAGERNVISGNGALAAPDRNGVFLVGTGAVSNTVQNNYIGLDATGAAALGNTRTGVAVILGASGNVIRDNVIAANTESGVYLQHANTTGNLIRGNRIGVNAAGTAALANGYNGVVVDGAPGNVIGGTAPDAGNVISGHPVWAGIFITGNTASGTVVQGNLIGTNAAGAAALPNGDTNVGGIYIQGAPNTVIGGAAPGARNVIAGNLGDGISLWGVATTGTVIQGNFIGVAADGVTPLGNLPTPNGGGVALRNGASGTTVGGVAPGEGNVIANNAVAGIMAYSGTDNTFRGNRLYNNNGLGIDLGGEGVTANDAGDEDTGANQAQNAPVVLSVAPLRTGIFVSGLLNSTPESTFQVDVYTNAECDPSGFGEGQTYLGTLTAVTDLSGNGVFSGQLPAAEVSLDFVTATATDADGNTSEFAPCAAAGPDNTVWPRALPLELYWDEGEGEFGGFSQSAYVSQSLVSLGQARWYRFAIQPGSRVVVELTGLPANYDLTLYGDIAAAHAELISPTTDSLVELQAEFAPDAYSPDAYSPDAYSPDAYSPDAYSPDAYSPDAYSPDAYSPDAYSAAQQQSLVGVSAFNGTTSEGLSKYTWEATGDFYIRVRGRNGAFDPNQPFSLSVRYFPGNCGAVDPGALPASTLTPTAAGLRTLILTDLSRLPGTPAERAALQSRLLAFAARAEIDGALIDVGADARIQAANALADTNVDCVFAKNVLAESIKQVVDAYRALNPDLAYIVLVGADDVIPFFRHPDQAGLANEQNYIPPVRDATASQASLRLGYVLGQDRYGASRSLALKDDTFPIPDLAVGRLVETVAEITTMLDAYEATGDGVIDTPTAALVTGYDFLVDAAEATRAELAAGLGAGADVDSLIMDRDLSPQDPSAWTANDLRAALFSQRHDLLYLAGHFSAGSTLAADYSTRLTAQEVAASATDFTNAIVFSAGCHSGYNLVNAHGVTAVSPEPDWAQAFARQGATLIAGTGYQYGETILLEYGERLYLEFARQLRAGTGPVAVGQALVRAKQQYLAETPEMRGIHEKTVLQSTLFGLPMLMVNLPAGRGTPAGEPSVVPAVSPVAANPGSTLGLQTAELTITPTLTSNTVNLVDLNTGANTPATYLTGGNGYVVNPGELVLPLERRNVTVTGQVLRGVGFRGGRYTDQPNVLPLVGAATTEVRGVHTPFLSDVFYPVRPWAVNYFDALDADGGDVTRLMLRPAQYRSAGPLAATGTLRQFSQVDFRLYYSNNTQVYGGGSTPALAAPPAITFVSATTDTLSANVTFALRVVGNPAAGVQEVWVTYTDPTAPAPEWRSFNLTQDAADSTLWAGTLPLGGIAPENFYYMAQAVNGVGLVALDTNLGAYYRLGEAPAPADLTATTLELTQPFYVGEYGTTAVFTARLLDAGGQPVAGRLITLNLGAQRRSALTGGDGRAQFDVPLLSEPGGHGVEARFNGDEAFAASGATSFFFITQRTTALVISPTTATATSGATTVVTATLTDIDGRPLGQKTVFFVVGPYAEAVITDFAGRAVLNGVPLTSGVYPVTATFGSFVTPPGATEGVDLTDPRYGGASATATLTIVDNTPPVTTATVTGLPATGCGPELDVYAASGASVTLTANEPAAIQYRTRHLVSGVFGPWTAYTGPVAVTTAGLTTVEFFATDAAGNVEAVQTLTVKVVTAAFAPVLDNFNRRDGGLVDAAHPWAGATGGYAIRSQRVDVFGGGALYWRGPSLGVDQEAYLTLSVIAPFGHHSLQLKVQGSTPDWRRGVIDVAYDPFLGGLVMETYRPGVGGGWTVYGILPVTYQAGDRLGARALANGQVQLYRNCVHVGTFTLTTADQAFFNTKGGRIGLWMINASPAFLDDFGGGNVPR